jgi:hypothetical protein
MERMFNECLSTPCHRSRQQYCPTDSRVVILTIEDSIGKVLVGIVLTPRLLTSAEDYVHKKKNSARDTKKIP